MVNMWLYAADGRALYFVSVPVPMPTMISFAGLTFGWDTRTARYVQTKSLPSHPGPIYTASAASSTEDEGGTASV